MYALTLLICRGAFQWPGSPSSCSSPVLPVFMQDGQRLGFARALFGIAGFLRYLYTVGDVLTHSSDYQLSTSTVGTPTLPP